MVLKIILAAGLVASLGVGQVAQNAGLTVPAPATSYLGVGIQEVDAERAAELDLPAAGGVEITRLQPASPADLAGLTIGDVVTEVNGEKITSIEQFSGIVRSTRIGVFLELVVYRNGTRQTISAKTGSSQGITVPAFPPPPRTDPGIPDVPLSLMMWRSPVLGVEAESLDGQLAEFFGIAEGVLVRSVVVGSSAERAGIKAGDVIVKVDGADVKTPAEITARLRGAGSNQVTLVVVRDRKELAIPVLLDGKRAGNGTYSGSQ